MLVSEHDAVPAGDDQPRQRLALLQECLKIWPESPYGLVRLAELALRSDEVGATALAELGKLQSSGSRSQVLQLLGVAAVKLDKYDKAFQYYVHVLSLEAKDPLIQNNLAVILRPRAAGPAVGLELADLALKKAPNEGEFHETRGSILLKLQRWSDAAQELNAALEMGVDRPETHESLAVAYDQLKQPELADQHRQKSGSSEEPNKPGTTAKPSSEQ